MQTAKLFISNSNLKQIEFIPKKEYSLNSNDVIIYTIYLPSFINLKSDLANFLNSTEINRVERFHKEIDGNRFIIYRSILKLILAAYTKLDVKNICFDYHSNKKPYLASHPWLHFNISHSEDYAIIAVSRKKVGIDVEFMSEDFNFNDILPDIFNENEILSIQNAANRKHAFYTSWTRKEAFVKALGKGIDEDFKYIPCLDGQHIIDTTLLKTTENWKVFSLNIEDQYRAAVAMECLPKITPNIVLFTLPNTINTLIGN
ncbi:MAG TPA: 4'-phosphopantetheinyl transferase superfamily protein [Flavobacterium alvei]|nr:4'-phosphopantetheinyl transferase superfamily protein [Flavobacterium alvei]